MMNATVDPLARTPETADDLIGRIQEARSEIIDFVADAEKDCRLPDSLNELMLGLGCFHMFRPTTRGGLGFDPVSAFRVVEALTRIDSALGWNVALGNCAEPFGAWFPEETNTEIHGNPDTVLAGGFNPPRKAVPVDGGYLLTGRCDFNSNVHASTHLQGLAMVYDGDAPRMSDDGQPIVLLTVFRTDDATIVDNWDTLGMRGTGSHDVEVNELFVPEAHAVVFEPMETPTPGYDVPLSYMTVWPPVALNAVPAIGIAQATVDAFIDLADKKAHAYTGVTLRDKPLAQMRLAMAQAKVDASRDYLFNTFERCWETASKHQLLSMQERANCQQATTHALLSCAEAVDLIHTIIGTDAIRNDKPFQRFKRDIHVITQHAYFCEARMESVGEVRLGLDPSWPFFYD
ncbi:MAG: hypothetical protein R3268_11735 [Acidiferrobacterales bacterium]|nr:hypothetical protein [Acidiferrobacterales bacterium]